MSRTPSVSIFFSWVPADGKTVEVVVSGTDREDIDDPPPAESQVTLSITPSDPNEEEWETVVDLPISLAKALIKAMECQIERLSR